MVGHLTRKYSRIAWYFLTRGGSISVEASSHRRHCKQLWDGTEIPCWVTFTCSRKATLKALLKVVIYANLRHGVQMFSQISRIPDLIRKFWAKRCCLYAGVYGNSTMELHVPLMRKKSLQSYCSGDLDFLALMRFDMTFNVTLCDDSSYGKITNSCH